MAEPEVSLLEYLDLSQLTCLNESEEHTFKTIVADKKPNTGGAYVLSDADEQLLLSIPFNQAVKVRSIAIRSASAAQAPRTLRLVTNKPSLSFDDVEDGASVLQELELSADDVREGRRVPLRFVRFQSVNSLHIFVVSNQGGEDETRIDSIDIFGMPLQGTRDVSGLKKVEDE
ncbi:PITH domain-containing protein [Trametes pubescens]|uniref:PITH domain-containing protein n=1 Tax=Trametes pubescens TaxID=154538 RepID=A0A1M2W361_TRAPU|nr:PITH domain-containing protein [Trametes pubescens]